MAKKLSTLTKRAQFLHAKKGKRAHKNSFVLQMIKSAPISKTSLIDETELNSSAGIGYTITKKTGNSPQRSRIKRRLKAATNICAHLFKPDYDYVLIARQTALTTPFIELVKELEKALFTLHITNKATRNFKRQNRK